MVVIIPVTQQQRWMIVAYVVAHVEILVSHMMPVLVKIPLVQIGVTLMAMVMLIVFSLILISV